MDQATKLLYLKPETLKNQLKSHLFELVKHKREKYRNEIRTTRLSSELNLKRFKICQNSNSSFNCTNHSLDNRDILYEEVNSLLTNFNNKTSLIIDALNKLKTLISEDIEYSLKFIKKYNILSHIVGFFEAEYDYCLELQMQVLWTLSNMSSLDVDDIYMVEFINAHPKIINNLMRFLNSNNDSLLQNTLWALGNIIGKSNDFKFQLLKEDIVEKIIDIFQEKDREFNTLIETLWLISNLCRGNPYPKYSEVKKFLPLLKKCIIISEPSIIENTLWALAYLSDGSNDQIKNILSLGITSKLISLTLHNKKEIRLPAVRTLCNLLTSDDSDTEILIENGVLDHLIVLLDDENKLIRKEVSWGIYNIFVCNEDIIEEICSHKIIDKIFNHCFYDEYLIREELITGLASAVTRASKNEMMMFIEKEIISLFLQMLEFPDSKLVLNILTGLESVLDFLREQKKPILEDKSLKNRLEELQYHPDVAVWEKTQKIIENFFLSE